MDLTSYLMGKNAGGGGGSPTYTLTYGTQTSPGWHKIMEQVDEITVTGTSCAYLFYGCKATKLPKVKGTETIKNLSYMFASCSNLKKVDLSKNTFGAISSVFNMFGSCSKLAVIDISSIDISNLTSSSSIAGIFSSTGSSCSTADGAYATNIPYVYVKNSAMQNWVLNTASPPSSWTTDNVVIKS